MCLSQSAHAARVYGARAHVARGGVAGIGLTRVRCARVHAHVVAWQASALHARDTLASSLALSLSLSLTVPISGWICVCVLRYRFLTSLQHLLTSCRPTPHPCYVPLSLGRGVLRSILAVVRTGVRLRVRVGLYTILPLPILYGYGVWHAYSKGGRGGVAYCAMVVQPPTALQPCGRCTWEGRCKDN